MTITLESIKAEQSKLGEMIAVFERQIASTEHVIAGVTIKLAPGERYAGIVIGNGTEPDYHLILLPGDEEDVTWAAAREWAEGRGGILPTRREQSLLIANLKSEFEGAYYWSGEQHESNSGWAWCQGFSVGHQRSSGKNDELRARAVRRLILQ